MSQQQIFLRVLPTRWRQKPADIDMEENYVTVILCIIIINRNVRRILVRGVNAPCRLRRRKFWKVDYEMVHREVNLNKYVVSIAPFSTPACPDCSQNIQKTVLFCTFSLLNFSSIFPGGQLTPFAPMRGRPCQYTKYVKCSFVIWINLNYWSRWIRFRILGPWSQNMVSVRRNSVPG